MGFGFGLVWMTVGLGPAILCVLLAALGYGAVFVAERARDNARPADEFELDHEHYYEPLADLHQDDATSPLAAEADYGWPVQEPEVAHSNDR
ncbi:MAG TPA: hypothetical protein VFU30_00550 [Gaiellaceae bacterium]|nr:hypothetical protein [Gaiellaceae bacterium]